MSKQIWGNITWKLFHCFTIKINDDATYHQIQECIDIIKSICRNLPCPICSQDASVLLRQVNTKLIKNKEEFIHFVYVFHNKVNYKLKKPMFNKELLFQTYDSMSFNQVLNDFFRIYTNMKHNSNMMLYSFHRNLIVKVTREYLLKNRSLYGLN